MTVGAMPTLIAANRGWSRTGPDPAWPNAAPEAVITDPTASAPVLEDQQNRQSNAESARLAPITAVASARPAAKSP